MSFGMIFSIILIVFFIAFAFYAIKILLGFRDDSQIKNFANDLQLDIDKIWKESSGSKPVSYTIPGDVKKVCFTDDEFENMIFDSEDYISGFKIQHINIEEITKDDDPYCIFNKNGKVSMILKKGFREDLITIQEG